MYTNVRWHTCLMFFILILSAFNANGQKDTLSFWEYPEELHRGRFWTAAATGAGTYTATLITLNGLWYNKFPRTSFHFFNDAEEWMQMDKAGHLFTAYFESDWLYPMSRWTGMKRRTSIYAAAILSSTLQATIETLDGFSSEWGFSVYDFAANLAGSGIWTAQQAIWDEQRIRFKVSSTFRQYPAEVVMGSPGGSITLNDRAEDLFGENLAETFLKDYNAQTIWMSVNVHSFFKPESSFPKWLNFALGYGAENMFGGFRNEWKADGNTFMLSNERYPRHRQWYLSPDVDLSKIRIKSPLLKTLVCMANIFKIPAPALEFNGNGKLKWKWLYY